MTTVLIPPFRDASPQVRPRHAHSHRRYTARSREVVEASPSPGLIRFVPLGALLTVQAYLSWHLIRANTAFLDEATYLGSGHQLLHAWLHGGPNMAYDTYFSGAPVIYPVIGALFDSVGGLTAVRLFSLALMLCATVLAYASARRLAGTVAGWFAAAVFVSLQGTQYLGAFATFDAMALTVMALAAWIVIRAGTVPGRVSHSIYWAAPVIAFGDATKYASAIFDPVIIVVAFFVISASHGWRVALRFSATLAALTIALVSAMLAIAGSQYWTGITSTTTNRAGSTASVGVITSDTVKWIGAVIVLSAIGALVMVVMALLHRISWSYALLAVTLFGATLLAPANQARIHTATSLSKHVNYGAWFGALLAGYLLSCVVGRGVRNGWRYAVALPLVAAMFVAGTSQARQEFGSWINTTTYVKALTPLVNHSTGHILADDVSVPTYYLGAGVDPNRWVSSFYFRYTPPGASKQLAGVPAYTEAIRNDYFSVIALDWGDQRSVDQAIGRAIGANRQYHFVGKYRSYHSPIKASYVIWQLGTTTKVGT